MSTIQPPEKIGHLGMYAQMSPSEFAEQLDDIRSNFTGPFFWSEAGNGHFYIVAGKGEEARDIAHVYCWDGDEESELEISMRILTNDPNFTFNSDTRYVKN